MKQATFRSLRRWYLFFAILFSLLAVYGSLVPFRYSPVALADGLSRFFDSGIQVGIRGGRIDWAVNFLLFIPVSYFWLGVIGGENSRLPRRVFAMATVFACCTGLSFLIEIGQVWFPPRVPSFADVVAQMLGTGVGCLVWLLAGSTIGDWIRLYLAETRPTEQVDWLLQAYLVGLVLYSVMPLDLTVSPTELFNKYEDAGKIVIVPFSYDYGSAGQFVYELCTDIIVFVPVGLLAASALTPTHKPVRSMAASLALGIAIVLGIELVQLLVLSRFTDTTDLISGSVGVAVGAWLMRRWRGSTRLAEAKRTTSFGRPSISWKWFFAAVAYAALLVLLFWAPFDFTFDKEAAKQRLEGFFALPLSSALRGSRFGAFNVLLRKVLLFIPLGVLLSLSVGSLPKRFRRLALAVLLFAAWGFALGVELGQIVLPGRVAVFDDTLLCALGAFVGAVATERILSRSHQPDRDIAEVD